MKGDWREKIRSGLRHSEVRFDAPLRAATTLRIGGAADCLVDLESEEELEFLFATIAECALPFFILGKGSNVLISDAGLRGVVVRLGRAFAGIERDGDRVRAGAGCPNASLVEQCRRWGLGGMEFLVAVPGSIGGAVAMNAGAHAGDTAGILAEVRYLQIGPGLLTEPGSAFAFDYRHSPLRGQLGRVVLAAQFQLAEQPGETIATRIAEFQSHRRNTQPRDFPNCGSIFKNPPGDYAARLVESAGLKGKCLGGAQVSIKHANFIVNRGGASAADVLALVDLIRKSVYSHSGIALELELQVI